MARGGLFSFTDTWNVLNIDLKLNDDELQMISFDSLPL